MLILHVNRMFRRVCIAKSWPLSKCFLEYPKLYIISCILLFYIMYHSVQCISDQTHTARGRWCNCVQFHGLVLRFKIVIAALWTTRSLLNAKRDLGCTTVRLHILLSGPHLLIVQIKYQFGENAVLSHVFLNVTCVWTTKFLFTNDVCWQKRGFGRNYQSPET